MRIDVLLMDFSMWLTIIVLEVVILGLFIVLRFLSVALSNILLRALLLGLFLIWGLNSTIFDKEWSLEYLSIYFDHLVLVVHLLLFLFPFELLYLISYYSSWLVYINIAWFQSLPHNGSELLLSQLPNCLRSFLFLYLFLSLFKLPSSQLN